MTRWYGRAGTPGAPFSLFINLSAAVFFVLLVDEGVGHAGYVIADDTGQGIVRGFFSVVSREVVGFFHPVGEEFAGDALSIFFFGG
jgi:hypothetical protein